MTHQRMCVLAARAAAAVRSRGSPDPLSHVEQVDREILEKLGVGNVEIEENVLGCYRHLRNILEDTYPEAALGAMNGILALYNSGTVGRREAADTWLKAAGMHYRLGRPMQALFCASRGVLTRPTIVGRPLRTALVRLAGMLRN
jgi:hypothetical protein